MPSTPTHIFPFARIPPSHRSRGSRHSFCRRLSFDTSTPSLSEQIIAQSQGLKEKHDSLHTLLRGRGGRFGQPGFCPYK